MKLVNIKEYAIEYIKALRGGDTDEIKQAFENTKRTIEELKQARIVACLNNPNYKDGLENIFGKNVNTKDTGLFLEVQFAILIEHLGINGKIIKIPTQKYKHPDFLIQDKDNQPFALVECTTLNLNKDDTQRLNKQLVSVLKTESYMVPELYVPHSFLTTLLGFNDLKKKIREKVAQIQDYISHNPEFRSTPKFIIIDISWFNFDARIRTANIVERLLPELRNTFLRGEGDPQQMWILNLIRELRNYLIEPNITVLFSIGSLFEIKDSPYGCLLAVDHAKMYPFVINDLKKFHRVTTPTRYDFEFEESFTDHWCENNLFFTQKSGQVVCPRFISTIESFIYDHLVSYLTANTFPSNAWLERLIEEITFFNGLSQKYEVNIDYILKIENYERKIAQVHELQRLTPIELLHIHHYTYEKLYFKLSKLQKVGDKHINHSILYTSGSTQFEAIKDNYADNIDQNVLLNRRRKAIEHLKLQQFNTLNSEYKLFFNIAFDII